MFPLEIKSIYASLYINLHKYICVYIHECKCSCIDILSYMHLCFGYIFGRIKHVTLCMKCGRYNIQNEIILIPSHSYLSISTACTLE